MRLRKIDIPEIYSEPLISSIDSIELYSRLPRQDLSGSLVITTRPSREQIILPEMTLDSLLNNARPAAKPITEAIWARFCGGTYWFFRDVVIGLERMALGHDEEPVNRVQFAALLLTLQDDTSQPVVLFPEVNLV